ncbi:MAG: 30S ribosomal protein S11 [Candidatus Methanofastidiosa archaeon]|nr:30S ribosomal protein S11 [Candidatus Methanofastidiosa archaeon]
MKKGKTGAKKKVQKITGKAKVYVNSTFNNTIITVTDETGNVVSWSSSGASGFKGTKKGTPFAAQIAAQKVAEIALNAGAKKVSVLVKGGGPGREVAIRALQSAGLDIEEIKDITPIPHNGCRPRKLRRV